MTMRIHVLLETMDGVNDRKKFRIRIYGGCADKISLEVKYKLNGMTKKDSCMLTEEQCRGDYGRKDSCI